MDNVITGGYIKMWRKSAGIDQKEVAAQMGVSPSTLCRIEREDRKFSNEQADRLLKIYSSIKPDSPIAKATAKMPEIVAESRRGALEAVNNLSSIGSTYLYQDYKVVPSQYYAKWSGQEPRCVNQAIDRLQEQGRLEIGEDFFKLNHEESKDFIKITNCDLDFQNMKWGLILITRKVVNTLTHYFNDPNSVAKSKIINSGFTAIEESPSGQSFESVEQIINSDMSNREKMAMLGYMCQTWLDVDKKRSLMGAQIEVVSKSLLVTTEKAEATQAELEAHKQSSRFTSDQIEALETAMREKIKDYGHGCVKGLIQRYLKQIFLAGRAHSNTYKDIASRHYGEALVRVKNWIPTPTDRESINRHRIKDGVQPTYEQPELFRAVN